MDYFYKAAKCVTNYITSYSAHGRQSMLIVFSDLFGFLILNCHLVCVISEEVRNPNYVSWNSLSSTNDEFLSEELTKLTWTTILVLFGLAGMMFAILLANGIYKRSSYLVNMWLVPNIFIIIPGGILAIHLACNLEYYKVAMYLGGMIVFRAIQCLCVQEYYWELTGRFGIIQHHEINKPSSSQWDQSKNVFEEVCI